MDFKPGLLVFILLAGCSAISGPEDVVGDLSGAKDIIGGVDASFVKYPYMVLILAGAGIKSLISGGTLLSTRTVLTAAHCINAVYTDGALSSTLRLTVGTNSWSVGGTKYKVERNVTHPHYVNSVKTNDIGFLITTTDVVFGNLVQPVRLTYDFIEGGVPCIVTGWGRLARNGKFPSKLQELAVTTVDAQECVTSAANASVEFRIRAPAVVPALQVCTFHSAGHGICSGDSGGPLIRTEDGLQFGIVSWGFPCARGAPDIFTRISAYRKFIEDNTV